MIWMEMFRRKPFTAVFYPGAVVIYAIFGMFNLLGTHWLWAAFFFSNSMLFAAIYESRVRIMLYQMLFDTNPQMEK